MSLDRLWALPGGGGGSRPQQLARRLYRSRPPHRVNHAVPAGVGARRRISEWLARARAPQRQRQDVAAAARHLGPRAAPAFKRAPRPRLPPLGPHRTSHIVAHRPRGRRGAAARSPCGVPCSPSAVYTDLSGRPPPTRPLPRRGGRRRLRRTKRRTGPRGAFPPPTSPRRRIVRSLAFPPPRRRWAAPTSVARRARTTLGRVMVAVVVVVLMLLMMLPAAGRWAALAHASAAAPRGPPVTAGGGERWGPAVRAAAEAEAAAPRRAFG
eukprot:scaffold685_cov324-Prasinococcus_capsulatus_cf.AAC.6